MWRDICLLNRDAILDMIKRFQATLSQLKRMIEAEDGEGMYKEFERAKEVRDSLKAAKVGE